MGISARKVIALDGLVFSQGCVTTNFTTSGSASSTSTRSTSKLASSTTTSSIQIHLTHSVAETIKSKVLAAASTSTSASSS
eukprot:07967.XXX_166270_166509_1 [CDS] Oithona nana genome sequencing.